MATLINGEIVLSLIDTMEIQERKKQKTYQQRMNQRRKNQEKYQRNQDLSVLPLFASLKSTELIFINHMTAFFVLIRLIERVREIQYFTIDTESDAASNKPALIQVELINVEQMEEKNEKKAEKTTIILFEMFQLPSKKSIIYPRVQLLFDIIFHPSKTMLMWGHGKQELSKFTMYELFQHVPVHSLHIINVQHCFKNWYNHTYRHDDNCHMALMEDPIDNPNCICSHRLYKNPGDTWSLQRAIAMIFEQFFDKSPTRSNWGQGLDIRLYQNIRFDVINYNVTSSLTAKQEHMRQILVQYAINDCLATTKLAFNIGNYLVEDQSH